MNGAATNPDAHVVAFAAAQVKKGLDIAKKLGAENFGQWEYLFVVILCPDHLGQKTTVNKEWLLLVISCLDRLKLLF